jgi:hypothetical protein
MKFLAAALFVSLPAAACPGLELSDGWIREAPPGAAVMAAYARLRNAGPAALDVEKARSAEFGAAELHRTVVENGISRMLRGQILRLPPGASAALEPGGWHLMLFRPARQLKAGDEVAITLECGKTAQSFPFTVRNKSE